MVTSEAVKRVCDVIDDPFTLTYSIKYKHLAAASIAGPAIVVLHEERDGKLVVRQCVVVINKHLRWEIPPGIATWTVVEHNKNNSLLASFSHVTLSLVGSLEGRQFYRSLSFTIYQPPKLGAQLDSSKKDVVSGATILATLSKLIPGINADHAVNCPSCGSSHVLTSAIMHLNDIHKWTREKIADWLETLDVDLSFAEQPSDVKPTSALSFEDELKQLLESDNGIS